MTIKEQLALKLAKVGIMTNIETTDNAFDDNQLGHLVLTFPDGVVLTIIPGLDFPDEPNMPVLHIHEGEV